MNINQIKQNISLNPQLKDDPTAENWLALFEAITDREFIKNPNKRNDSRKYLSGLYDEDEAKDRIAYIDYMNNQDIKTDLQRWYKRSVKKDISCKKGRKSKFTSKGRPASKVIVINKFEGTKKEYSSMKEACEEYDLNYKNVNSYYSRYQKNNTVTYHGLIFKKLK